MKNLGRLFLSTCFLLPFLTANSFLQACALQIVYPKTVDTEVSADSTFFIGSTLPGSSLKINDKVVKVYDNGSFVEVVPLKDGLNKIKIDSENEKEHNTFTYVIKKVPKTNLVVKESETEDFPDNQYIYATVIKDGVPLRAQPDEFAKRLTHLDKNTILMLNGKNGDYYRVSLSPVKNAWIKSDSIVNYSTINTKMLAGVTDVSLSDDKLYNYIKTKLSFQVPYSIVETDKGLNVELYNIKENAADSIVFNPLGYVKNFALNTTSVNNLSTYFIELNGPLWGYDSYYEDNTFVIRIRKAPETDIQNPLKNIVIALDAGHGGDDYGAIGPTGVKEKDINLDVAIKVKELLEKSGAKVILTRENDTNIALYDRPKKAKENNALIMLSIHANALPDGADPYVKHGTSVFYYNKEAIELAKIMRDTVTKELGTKDDGVCMRSFVMTRPTMPLSVLVEVAYMIHPDEYKLLLDEDFRQKSAQAITKAFEIYILNSVKPVLNQ